MNARIWGIIGGVALVLTLLSPLVLGSAQKLERLFEAAEALYERSDYENAIEKYKEALKESKKLGTKTERIDKEFNTLANLKIARCYYELAEDSSDDRHYQDALTYISKVVLKAQAPKYQEELTYLLAEIFYKTGDFDQAASKFFELIEKFPKGQWRSKALYTIGDINFKQQNYDTAQKTFQKLIADFPQSEFKADAEQRIAKIKLLTEKRKSSEESDSDNHDWFNHVPESQAKTMHDNARDFKQQGRFHDAYQLYADLIKRFPESEYVTDAYVGKAEIHLDAKDYVNARANYEEAMYSTDDDKRKIEIYKKYQLTYLVPVHAEGRRPQEDRDNVLHFIDARRLRKEGNFLKAAKLYERLTDSKLPAEDTLEALYWTGYCYYKAALTDPTLFNKSVNAFKKLIGNYNSNGAHTIEAYYYLTLVYVGWAQVPGYKSKYELVINTVEEANTKYTNSGNIRDRGWLNRMQEFKQKAIQELVPPPPPPPPVLILNPTQLVDEGYRHLGSGELEEATKKARQALNINEDYQRARQLLSEIKETYYGCGWTFFDEEQYAKAIASFKNALNIDPKFKEAHCHLGVIYIEQQRYTEAVKVLEKATEIDQRFKEAHFNLALAYLRLGKFEFAKNAANVALEIDTNYEPARILIDFIAD